jgi:hypothetical protein
VRTSIRKKLELEICVAWSQVLVFVVLAFVLVVALHPPKLNREMVLSIGSWFWPE